MNFLYKALNLAAGHDVVPGEKVRIEADLVLAHDGTAGKMLDAWDLAGKPDVVNGDRVLITLDHQFPAPNVAARLLHKRISAFASGQRVHLCKRGEGVLHQIVAEKVEPRPGTIIAGADGHVATAGAFGAIAFSLKPEEMIPVLATGYIEFEVPEVLCVKIENRLPSSSTPRDLALLLAANLAAGPGRGKAVLISGKGASSLSLAGKMTLCNMLGETGAVTGLILPEGNEDCEQSADLVIDAAKVEPVVACPPSVTNIKPVRECGSVKLTQVVVGGCSSGRLEDMRDLCRGLGTRKVHPDIQLIVTPASASLEPAMADEGITRTLRRAGAVINTPGCGPCPGLHQGILGPGDRVLATIVRNSAGRMGSPEAEIYLGSPLTAGFSAAAGIISGF